MKTIGRVLRHLRRAALLTVDDAAVALSITPQRLRELEAGLALPNCFETADLAKPYLLNAASLAMHLRAALAHEMAALVDPFTPPEPSNPFGDVDFDPTDDEEDPDHAAA